MQRHMRRDLRLRFRLRLALVCVVFLFVATGGALAQSLPTAAPESQGFSS